MDVTRVRDLGRARALDRMRIEGSTARHLHRGDPLDLQPGDFEQSYEWEQVAEDVPCRLDEPTSSNGIEVGGTTYEQATAVLHLPWDHPDIRDGDHFDITGGESAGRVVEIVKATRADQKTARRLPVREVDRPKEWL